MNKRIGNLRLEYEQIIATLHNTEIIELGINVFIIPLVSWGLALKEGSIFRRQEIRIIGIISIIIWFIYLVCSCFIYVRKVKKLLDRARVIWNCLNDYFECQTTHISILYSRNFVNFSNLFRLIGCIVCVLWILKYKLFFW